jgi:hypothetical protein
MTRNDGRIEKVGEATKLRLFQCQWHTPVILATHETMIRRIKVQDN